MRTIERQKILQVRDELLSLVRDGYPETAYCLLEETLGEEDRWSIEPTVDLMKRIMALCPGEQGIELAVDALCGIHHLDERQNFWFRARFEQDVEEARSKPFAAGFSIEPMAHCCGAGKKLAGCYRMDNIPTLPIDQCDAEPHCCCGWNMIFVDEEPPSPWKK